MRIFVVENHRDTLKYLKMFLESLGHSVTTARTMKAAQAAIPTTDCQVFISDIGLPDGNGWDAAVKLRDTTRAQMLELSGEPDLRYEIGQVERHRPAPGD